MKLIRMNSASSRQLLCSTCPNATLSGRSPKRRLPSRGGNRRKLLKGMARPSVASLNTLAEIIRQAKPLYQECRSIINYIEPHEGASADLCVDGDGLTTTGTGTNNDGASRRPTSFEQYGSNR